MRAKEEGITCLIAASAACIAGGLLAEGSLMWLACTMWIVAAFWLIVGLVVSWGWA